MNEIEKVIDELVDLWNDIEHHKTGNTLYSSEREKAFNLSISSLEKQIPKKPIRLPWSISRCPSCSTELGEWLEDGYYKDWEHLKICDCGQKLDWSVEDE